ncbi:MAG: SAM-dependent methyltransferase [Clostridia bacterium]|nr:SAM-dependent methyltransferase [Clostridia bacterium]
MKKIKNRLYTVSTLVPFGARVADIGCDHGHLPIYLMSQGISPFCIASDIKEQPLMSAQANIKKVGLNIETRLGAGLSTIKEGEVDCITIAGMGGEVIAAILEDCPFIKDPKYTLVLQPMTSADALRKYLCENGFCIETEVGVEENRKIYTVIKAVFSGESFCADEAFLRIGRLDPTDPTARKYIEKQVKIITELIADRKQAGLDAERYVAVLDKMKSVL